MGRNESLSSLSTQNFSPASTKSKKRQVERSIDLSHPLPLVCFQLILNSQDGYCSGKNVPVDEQKKSNPAKKAQPSKLEASEQMLAEVFLRGGDDAIKRMIQTHTDAEKEVMQAAFALEEAKREAKAAKVRARLSKKRAKRQIKAQRKCRAGIVQGKMQMSQQEA